MTSPPVAPFSLGRMRSVAEGINPPQRMDDTNNGPANCKNLMATSPFRMNHKIAPFGAKIMHLKYLRKRKDFFPP
jgi:hypothetical protein